MKTGIVLAVVIAVAVADVGFDPENDCFRWNAPWASNGGDPLKAFNDCGVFGKRTAMINADSGVTCAFKTAGVYDGDKLNVRRLMTEFATHVNPKFMPVLLKVYASCATSPTFVPCYMKGVIDVCTHDVVLGKDV